MRMTKGQVTPFTHNTVMDIENEVIYVFIVNPLNYHAILSYLSWKQGGKKSTISIKIFQTTPIRFRGS